MKHGGFVLSAMLAAVLAPGLRAEDLAVTAAKNDPVIALPPMIIAESKHKIDWLYVRTGPDECLSRCSPRTTQAFLEARSRQLFRLRAIVPADFLAELPSVTVLYDAALQPRTEDRVSQDLMSAAQKTTAARGVPVFLPNLRVDGRDVTALFAYLKEGGLRESELTITPGYLRALLERRAPALPPWLVEGILTTHAQIDPAGEPVTLRPFTWLSEAESRALARNPERPRALLPASEMFAPDALRGEGNQHPKRAQTLWAQVALFVRWGLDPRNHVRAAFWQFAQQASEHRVTEERFARCFGFGFSDLRDRLDDYLPIAVKESLRLDPGDEPSFASDEPRNAKPEDVARLRGEWERLEIAYVQRMHPELAPRYASQARLTLRTAYDSGLTDPRLQLTLGLCEIDAGNATAGVPFLEAAIAAGANRPSAGYEVARFRFSALTRGQPPASLFSAAELAPIVEPLRGALTQNPQLPEIFGLLAEAWTRAREAPPASDLETLSRGARFFAMNSAVGYRIALALARFGRRAEATELLATGIDYATDDAMRARYAQLQAALSGSAPAARE
jgi:hypothetical protein